MKYGNFVFEAKPRFPMTVTIAPSDTPPVTITVHADGIVVEDRKEFVDALGRMTGSGPTEEALALVGLLALHWRLPVEIDEYVMDTTGTGQRAILKLKETVYHDGEKGFQTYTGATVVPVDGGWRWCVYPATTELTGTGVSTGVAETTAAAKEEVEREVRRRYRITN